ncbi:MAG: hypothetical protein ACE5JU_21340 [Candidatus Binatia bacterium]
MKREKDKPDLHLDQPPLLSQAVDGFRLAQWFASIPAPWFYHLPEELEPLAARLQLSPERVIQMIDAGEIPLRRRPWRRKLCILIQEALAAIQENEAKTNTRSPKGR